MFVRVLYYWLGFGPRELGLKYIKPVKSRSPHFLELYKPVDIWISFVILHMLLGTRMTYFWKYSGCLTLVTHLWFGKTSSRKINACLTCRALLRFGLGWTNTSCMSKVTGKVKCLNVWTMMVASHSLKNNLVGTVVQQPCEWLLSWCSPQSEWHWAHIPKKGMSHQSLECPEVLHFSSFLSEQNHLQAGMHARMMAFDRNQIWEGLQCRY